MSNTGGGATAAAAAARSAAASRRESLRNWRARARAGSACPAVAIATAAPAAGIASPPLGPAAGGTHPKTGTATAAVAPEAAGDGIEVGCTAGAESKRKDVGRCAAATAGSASAVAAKPSTAAVATGCGSMIGNVEPTTKGGRVPVITGPAAPAVAATGFGTAGAGATHDGGGVTVLVAKALPAADAAAPEAAIAINDACGTPPPPTGKASPGPASSPPREKSDWSEVADVSAG